MATVTMIQPSIAAAPILDPPVVPSAALTPVSQWSTLFEQSQKEYFSSMSDYERPRSPIEKDLRQVRSCMPEEKPYRRPSKSTKYIPRDNLSPEQIKHLERNRIAANKCRLKKKQKHREVQKSLDAAEMKQRDLQAEIRISREDIWQLKSQLLEHAGKCDNQAIYQAMQNMNQTVTQCLPPSYSFSTASSGSPESEARWNKAKSSAKDFSISSLKSPDNLFNSFLDLPNIWGHPAYFVWHA